MANVSAIFEHLGAQADEIPILWLAAPLTGLFVQPVIGYLSDNTWTPLGRRRPYFLIGALLSSAALVLMPNVSALWMAAGLLWILDASINISMEPFRALVGDRLVSEQQTLGFAMQSFFIGLGSVIASAFPWILAHGFRVAKTASGTAIPPTVKLAFYCGAAVFLGSVVWTVITTTEDPPDPATAETASTVGIRGLVKEVSGAFQEMPIVMRKLAWVQCFTWLGMFCFFLYFPPAVAWTVFRAPDQQSFLYSEGIEWAGLCIALYNAVCFGVAFILPRVAARLNRSWTHAICLTCGGVSLLSLWLIEDRYTLFLPMIGMGIAWASILSIPYAILMDTLPEDRRGLYTGIFNFYIVLPQIVASLGLGWVMRHLFHGDRVLAIVVGGVAMLMAAVFMRQVPVVDDLALARAQPDPTQASSLTPDRATQDNGDAELVNEPSP